MQFFCQHPAHFLKQRVLTLSCCILLTLHCSHNANFGSCHFQIAVSLLITWTQDTFFPRHNYMPQVWRGWQFLWYSHTCEFSEPSILVSNPLSLQCCKKKNFKSTKRRIIWRVLGSFSVWEPVKLTDDVNKGKGAHKTIKPQHELTKQRENTTAFHTKVNLFPETMLWVWATKKKKMKWSV